MSLIEIKKIQASDTFKIRSEILRPWTKPQEMGFANDEEETSLHLGLFLNQKLVSIASFHFEDFPENSSQKRGTGKKIYRLRGMATLTPFQGFGFGKKILYQAMLDLRKIQTDTLWCNARKVAYSFYEKMGFDYHSDEFDIPTIGPHRVMAVKISRN